MKINLVVRASTVRPPVTNHHSGEPIRSNPPGCRPNGFLIQLSIQSCTWVQLYASHHTQWPSWWQHVRRNTKGADIRLWRQQSTAGRLKLICESIITNFEVTNTDLQHYEAPYWYLCDVASQVYTGCPGGNVPDFGRMFLTLKYTDIAQTPISEVERLRR